MFSSTASRRRHGRGRSKPPEAEEDTRSEQPHDPLPAVLRKPDHAPAPRVALPNPIPPKPHPHPAIPSSSRTSTTATASSSKRRRRRRCRGPMEATVVEARDRSELPPGPLPSVPHKPDHAPRVDVPNPNPPEPQPHPAIPSSSTTITTSRRRRRRRRGRGRKEAAGEARDWAGLPLDAVLAILHKLDHIEILMGAGQVCGSWRRAARDHPVLWRRIDMCGHADLEHELNLYGMAQAAVRRSAGQCEAFWGEYAADHDLLLFLADRAPSLKSLRLISCYHVDDEGFSEAVKKFPLLEELKLSLCSNIGENNVFEVVGKACPQLKRFRLSKHCFYNFDDGEFNNFDDGEYNNDEEALGIATMHELRSLQLFGNNLTNEGLTAILDNCTHLESLDIRHCFNVTMNDAL